MKIVCYYPDYNDKHAEILKAFADGCGGDYRKLSKPVECDVAVIFGWHKHAFPPTAAKQPIIDAHQGRRLIVIESGFVRRGDYYQVGFGGFAGLADFRNAGSPSDRWESFGVPVHPWTIPYSGGAILVMGQLARDTQVQHSDHRHWCRKTVKFYDERGYNVFFRPHPREQEPSSYGIDKKYIIGGKIANALRGARCVVTYNSTSAVDAILAGVPTITRHRGSIAYGVTGHNLELAFAPSLLKFQREAWLAEIGYAQWTLDEMRRGLPWQHLSR
jgi:hypothetical protein